MVHRVCLDIQENPKVAAITSKDALGPANLEPAGMEPP